MLIDFFGVLRNESLHLADLRDFKILTLDVPGHQDQFNILLMVCETGKTVKKDGKPQYGRVIRHKDVFMCPVGAQGLWLLERIDRSGDFFYENLSSEFQSKFEHNKDWFEKKVSFLFLF